MDEQPSKTLKDFSPTPWEDPVRINFEGASEVPRQQPPSPPQGAMMQTQGGVSSNQPLVKEAAIKPFSFALAHRPSGAAVHFGQLVTCVTIMRFERKDTGGTMVNSLLSQEEIPKAEVHVPSPLVNPVDATELGWFGNVYLYWEVDRNSGEITLTEMRGPGEPSGHQIEDLSDELSRSGDDGKYFIKIGSVDAGGTIIQDIASDVFWSVTFIPEGEEAEGGEPGLTGWITTDGYILPTTLKVRHFFQIVNGRLISIIETNESGVAPEDWSGTNLTTIHYQHACAVDDL